MRSLSHYVLFLVFAALVLLSSYACGAAEGQGATPPVNDDRAVPLKVRVVSPWYRNTIYASQKLEAVRFEALPSIHINPGLLGEATLKAALVDSQEKAHGATETKAAGPSFCFNGTIDVAQLPVGTYRLTVSLQKRDGETLADVFGNPCVAEVPLSKLAAAKGETYFDDSGTCHVDGEPFFPVGMFHIWPNILDLANGVRIEKGLEPFTWDTWFAYLRDAGLTSFMDWQAGREPDVLRDRYDRAAKAGFRGLVHPETDRDLDTLRNHPGVLGWYTFDEPTLNNIAEETVAKAAARYRELDPHRPLIACDNSPSGMQFLAPHADVLMPDLYPQHNGDLRAPGKVVRYAKTLKDGRAVVWPIIQAFQISRYAPNADGTWRSFPRLDGDEMRCVVYDTIACGATGIYYYGYYTSEGPQDLPNGKTRNYYLIDDFPDQWEAIRRINGELAQLNAALVAGKALPSSVTPEDCDVNAVAFGGADGALLLVTNPSRAEQIVTIRVAGVPDQKAKARFSDAVAVVHSGTIKLTLPPVAVRVFPLSL